MNIYLNEKMTNFVAEMVQSGRYMSTSEVIRDGLELLRDQEMLRELRRKELREQLQVGLAELDRGESIPADEVFAELKRMSEERRRAGGGQTT